MRREANPGGGGGGAFAAWVTRREVEGNSYTHTHTHGTKYQHAKGARANERERERERECKIPLYNLDSESNLDMRSILNPLKSHNSLFMRPGSCPVWLGPVLSQCHSASLHPVMHLEHCMLIQTMSFNTVP